MTHDEESRARVVRTGSVSEVLAGEADLCIWQGPQVELFDGLPDESVEAVITDPPYYRKYQQCYVDCYRCSARVLRPHGDLLMIMGHYWLDPFNPMGPRAEGMVYRWTLAMFQGEGAYPRLPNRHRNMAVTYKPIGWWYKWGAKGDNFAGVVDSYQNPPPVKGHEWEQSEAWAQFCVDHLYFRSGVIVDPMVGSGTMAVEALRRGYRAIVGDVDQRAIDMTWSRVRSNFGTVGELGG